MNNILEDIIKEKIKSGEIKVVSLDELPDLDDPYDVKVTRKQFLSIMGETCIKTAKVIIRKIIEGAMRIHKKLVDIMLKLGSR